MAALRNDGWKDKRTIDIIGLITENLAVKFVVQTCGVENKKGVEQCVVLIELGDLHLSTTIYHAIYHTPRHTPCATLSVHVRSIAHSAQMLLRDATRLDVHDDDDDDHSLPSDSKRNSQLIPADDSARVRAAPQRRLRACRSFSIVPPSADDAALRRHHA